MLSRVPRTQDVSPDGVLQPQVGSVICSGRRVVDELWTENNTCITHNGGLFHQHPSSP